ncbi:unnamed protein product [Nesidiocoris tenuis]|uniref:Lines homolog (Drosophila) n=2 Tax=Nesidiocoris tenuis TaxID=355587 RepID=A0ABN7ABT9_9HEMI|nr:lines homolog (Drosophila) [Nesidiocoris tenuis]CAB0011694.1 unnamed protein product [Nesidiocoris tenuis]
MVLTKEEAARIAATDEPAKKKTKVSEEEDNTDLEAIQNALFSQCLCVVPESVVRRPFLGLKILHHEDAQGHCASAIANWSRNRTLMFVSAVQLLCEESIKQNARGFVCRRITDTCDALVRNRYELVNHLIELSAHSDRFVRYTAGKTLASFFIAARNHIDPRWLERLADNALSTSHPQKMSFSLDVMKRIAEWRDSEEHPLDESDHFPPSSCHFLNVRESELDSYQIKCLTVKALETKWPSIVEKFERQLATNLCRDDSGVVIFLGLWEAIISVKANLSIVDTKPFYVHLPNFVAILNSRISPIVWKHTLDLFNEVLCYGSTLALQESLAEEPCSLAHLIVRSVKDWKLLESIPFRGGSGKFGGGSGDGDKPLLKKAVLMVLKAVAVTVKETRCESSSDSSSSFSSEGEDADDDMAVIERSIREVLRQLDSCIKTLLPYHPEAPLAQWVAQLFSDQDDSLIEAMICCLDVTIGLFQRENASQDLKKVLSPSLTLAQFLRTVSYGEDVLLDLLISNETCFLLYLLKVLKYLKKNWPEFVTACKNELSDIMGVLSRLHAAIDRLINRSLFPYNITPVLKLLEKCERLYDGSDSAMPHNR